MGVCTNGDIQIHLQTVEDADYVCDQISKIEELTSARLKTPAHFNLQDLHVDGTTVNCNVYADRTPNGEFQVEEVVKMIKLMVKHGKIKPPAELQAELLVQHMGWYVAEDEFEEELND